MNSENINKVLEDVYSENEDLASKFDDSILDPDFLPNENIPKDYLAGLLCLDSNEEQQVDIGTPLEPELIEGTDSDFRMMKIMKFRTGKKGRLKYQIGNITLLKEKEIQVKII